MTSPAAKIEIHRLVWLKLVRELKRRSANVRESGAFLLAHPGNVRVIRLVYYDDLDPDCLEEGYIRFNGAGYVPLWKICQKEKLRVIGDVHTHPTSWTGQSEADKEHPMIAQKGHVALIIPKYACGLRLSLRGVGIFEYLGDGDWRHWHTRSGAVSLTYL